MLFRTDILKPFIKGKAKMFNLERLDYLSYSTPPDYIVYSDPNIELMINDLKGAKILNCDVRVIVLSSFYSVSLYEAVIPDAYVISVKYERWEDDVYDILSGEGAFLKRGTVSLTKREKDFLREMLMGLSVKESAIRLGLSERTTRRMRDNLLQKFALKNTIELMTVARFRDDIRMHTLLQHEDTE